MTTNKNTSGRYNFMEGRFDMTQIPRLSENTGDPKLDALNKRCNENSERTEDLWIELDLQLIDAMEAEGELDVSVHSSSDWVHIDIKDNGKGIPQKQLATIFEPGFSTKKRGWGLGLSLVMRIVKEYHKGRVFVLESEVGVGTTFRISLPVK